MSDPTRRLLWARLSVRHTKKTCLASCSLPIFALVLIIVLKIFTLSPSGGNDYFIKNDLRSELEDARTVARRDYPYRTGPPLPRSNKSPKYLLVMLLRNSRGSGTGKKARPARVDIAKRGRNLLTRESLAFLKSAEDRFMRAEGIERFCWIDKDNLHACKEQSTKCAFPGSITNHPLLYGVESNGTLCGRNSTADPVSPQAFDQFLNKLIVNGNVDPRWSIYMGKDFSSTTKSTQILRSFLYFGTPFSNAKNKTDAEQAAEYNKWAASAVKNVTLHNTDKLHVNILGESLASASFESIVLTDQAYSGISVVLVFIIIWVHTTSGLLASAALLQIMLAFPLTYLVYHAIFQVKYFAGLQVMTLFLLLGLGADDCFIFTDAWKQSGVVLGSKTNLENRMAWTYRRAFKAMSVTSFTTAAAFFCTATSPIMPISTLGIWAGFLVLLQFLLVCTIFPCAIIMWHRFWRVRTWRDCLKPPPPEEMNLDDESNATIPYPPPVAVAADDVSSSHWSLVEDAIRPSHISSESAHWMDNLALSRPRISSNIPPQENTTSDSMSPSTETIPEEKGFSVRTIGCFSKMKRREDEYRPIEKFFHGPWTNWMNLAKFPLIVLAVSLMAGSIYCATRLAPPAELENFLPENHPTTVALSLMTNAFPVRDTSLNVNVQIVWGLKKIDRSGTSRYNPDELGKPVLDKSFSLKSSDAQRTLLRACEFFENQKDLLAKQDTFKSSECWIRDFKIWLRTVENTTDFRNYRTETGLANDVISFARWKDQSGRQPYLKYLTEQRIALTNDLTKIIFTELNFVAKIKTQVAYTKMWPEYQRWIKAVEKFKQSTKSPGVKHPFAVGGVPWKWQMTQKALIDNMFLGIGVVLAVALGALTVSTGNLIVSMLALICIAGILTNLLGLLFIIGWTLGITESIGVVMAVGFSFDFVAHIANAYVETEAESRFKRTRGALTDLGISILAGALSTLLAGAMLFFATLVFFVKFGVFVVATIALSLLWGLAFFPCLLLAIGPVGATGDIMEMLRAIGSVVGVRRKSVFDAGQVIP